MAQIIPLIKAKIKEMCLLRGYYPKSHYYVKELNNGFWGLLLITYAADSQGKEVYVNLGIYNNEIDQIHKAIHGNGKTKDLRLLAMPNIGWLFGDNPNHVSWHVRELSEIDEVCDSIFNIIDEIAPAFFERFSDIRSLILLYENYKEQSWPIVAYEVYRTLPELFLYNNQKDKGLKFIIQYCTKQELLSQYDIAYAEKYDTTFGQPLLTVVHSGDIFSVITESGAKRYFQFVTKDTSEFDSDVIRIFKKVYPIDSSPSTAEIVGDTIECYMHTMVSWGLYLGLWTRSGSDDNIGKLDISFRRSKDYGRFSLFEKRVSNNWEVWTMNQPKQSVGMLPESHYSADIGDIGSPSTVLKRINEGYFPSEWYPLYREQQ